MGMYCFLYRALGHLLHMSQRYTLNMVDGLNRSTS